VLAVDLSLYGGTCDGEPFGTCCGGGVSSRLPLEGALRTAIFSRIGRITTLKHWPQDADRISDFRFAAELSELESINFRSVAVRSGAMVSDDADVADDALEMLVKLPKLWNVSFRGSLTPTQMDSLLRIPNLSDLAIDGSRATLVLEQILPYLPQASRLQSVRLHWVKLAENSSSAREIDLTGMPQLESFRLELDGQDPVTEMAMKRWDERRRTMLPPLKLVFRDLPKLQRLAVIVEMAPAPMRVSDSARVFDTWSVQPQLQVRISGTPELKTLEWKHLESLHSETPPLKLKYGSTGENTLQITR
jgi:hypothetical protein